MTGAEIPTAAPGLIRVAVVETIVSGVAAYHARCLECGWRCFGERRHQPHDREATALEHAKAHTCETPRRITFEPAEGWGS